MPAVPFPAPCRRVVFVPCLPWSAFSLWRLSLLRCPRKNLSRRLHFSVHLIIYPLFGGLSIEVDDFLYFFGKRPWIKIFAVIKCLLQTGKRSSVGQSARFTSVRSWVRAPSFPPYWKHRFDTIKLRYQTFFLAFYRLFRAFLSKIGIIYPGFH